MADVGTDLNLGASAPELMMHSTKLLSVIGFLINDLLGSQGRLAMLTVQNWSTGAFTTLDQLAEILYRCSLKGKENIEKAKGVIAAIYRFIGHARNKVAEVTRAALVHAFRMLQTALTGMVRLAIGR